MSFPETVSDSLCSNSLGVQTNCCSSWSCLIFEVKMLEVVGWCGYTWSAGCTAQFSGMPLKTAYSGEMNIEITATFALCDETADCPFIVESLTCVITKQHRAMPNCG